MSTFKIRPLSDDDDACWVHAIDEWDARDQVTRALGIEAHEEAIYECCEDYRFLIPLSVILHADGGLTGVPAPAALR